MFKDCLIYTPEQIANGLKPSHLPKPDPFTYYGKLMPGTGRFIPGTEVLVPGTGVFERNDGKKFIFAGFKLTRGGTHYRNVACQFDQNLVDTLIATGVFSTAYRQQELERYNAKLAKKKRYEQHRTKTNKRDASRNRIKKSEKRLVGQVIRDQKDFVLGLPKDNGTRRHKKQRNKIINQALSAAFKVGSKVIRRIRAEKERHSQLVNSGLAYGRGRYRKNRFLEKVQTHRSGEPYLVCDLNWLAAEIYGVEVPIAYTKPLSKAQTEIYQPAYKVKTGFDWWDEVGKKLTDIAIAERKWSPFPISQVENKSKRATPTAASRPCDVAEKLKAKGIICQSL